MIRCLTVAAALLSFATAAGAQAYPSKPITLIVPFSAGGPSDAYMRQLSVVMGRHLNQTIVVENVPGGGGTIGPSRVARAAPDGYTLLNHNLGIATNPALFKTLEYNVLTDFDYIGTLTYDPSVLMARADFPANSFTEFLAYVKAHQSKISFGDGGGPSLLSALLFMAHTGTQMTLVPYKGTGPAMTDLFAKRIDLLSNSSSVVAPHIMAGKVKAIGITGRTRVSNMPDVPTLHEQGLTGFEMVVWQALFAPKGLHKAVQERLVGALQASIDDPQMQAYFRKTGGVPATKEQATPAALQALVASEVDKWVTLLRKAGIKPQ
jgi:tripartite-type tricarboxylate transporter receptor subunit TctC